MPRAASTISGPSGEGIASPDPSQRSEADLTRSSSVTHPLDSVASVEVELRGASQRRRNPPTPKSKASQRLPPDPSMRVTKKVADMKASDVRTYFHVLRNEGKKISRCKICGAEYDTTKGSASRNNHLKSHEKEMSIKSLSTTMRPKAIPYASRPLPNSDQRKMLLGWLIQSNQPFMEIESPSFIRMVEEFSGHSCKLPGRTTIQRDLHRLYEEAMPRVMERILGRGSKICIQHDAWTSEVQNVTYLGLLANYTECPNGDFSQNSMWELKTVLISLDQLDTGLSHTAEAVSESILDILKRHGLTHRLQAMTTDNGSGNPQAFTKLEALLKGEGVMLEDGAHVRCGAHVVNLVAHDFLKALGAIGMPHGRDLDPLDDEPAPRTPKKKTQGVTGGRISVSPTNTNELRDRRASP